MIYQVDRLIKDVKVAIDQNNNSDDLAEALDLDTLTTDEIIESKIVDAVTRVEKQAPIWMLEEGHHFGRAIHRNEDGSGWIPLPDNFMRLVVFEMSDWSQPVYTLSLPGEKEYALQHSKFKGIRGTAERPICTLEVLPTGKVLEYHSSGADSHIKRATYIPYPRIDADRGIDISKRCYEAVVYQAAALVLKTFGDNDRANVMIELMKEELQ